VNTERILLTVDVLINNIEILENYKLQME